jgi:hypothetical protein
MFFQGIRNGHRSAAIAGTLEPAKGKAGRLGEATGLPFEPALGVGLSKPWGVWDKAPIEAAWGAAGGLVKIGFVCRFGSVEPLTNECL